jgi:hypothetical protein
MIVKVDGVSLNPFHTSPTTTGYAAFLHSNDQILAISGFFLPDTSNIHNGLHIDIINPKVGSFEIKGNVGYLDPPGSITISSPAKHLYRSWTISEAVVGTVTITKFDRKKISCQESSRLNLKRSMGLMDLT